MGFYLSDTQLAEQQEYEGMLQLIGSLSRMFSENDSPYLDSRISENLFCRYLNAVNLARGDVTADAKKGTVGIGIKTWMGGANQKIAEFDAERKNYATLKTVEEQIEFIARLRNDRINLTMRTNALERMVYHCIVRNPNVIDIRECDLVPIDLASIHDIQHSNTSFSFADALNKYSFNYAKSTLFKNFSDLITVKRIPVEIISDPFETLANLFSKTISQKHPAIDTSKIVVARGVLPLYSCNKKTGKYVPEKNNLNMRMANGRKRDPYEVGIPIPAHFRAVHSDFFPGLNCPFKLILPDGKTLIAKQCQQDGKALMSNPNAALGHWLIDQVFGINPETPFTYDLLAKYGIDSVELTKIKDINSDEVSYSIAFALCGSYEAFMRSLPEEE